MRITITGPRSVGKTTISKLLAEKLNLKYVSSDEIGEKALEKNGGLDKAIKSGIIKEILRKDGYSLILKEYENDGFVFDLSGGSISSQEFEKASEDVRAIANQKSIVIGLLPLKNTDESISFLFERELNRNHFKDSDREKLRESVVRNYKRISLIFENFCDHIVYVKDKREKEIVDDIMLKIKQIR